MSLKTHFKPGDAYKCVVLSVDGERNLLDLSLTGENSEAGLQFLVFGSFALTFEINCSSVKKDEGYEI